MKKKISNRSSANDLYDVYDVPQKLVKHKTYNLSIGIYDIGFYENCFWLIDIICQHKINFDVECWELTRNNNDIFTLTATNKQDFIFVELRNLQSDFYFDDFVILKKGKLLCLPVEEKLY